MGKDSSSRDAFTLVELLVVVSVVGILIALLLPAVQAARETARRTQCVSNLHNLATAALNHHDTVKHFPTGGWGWWWVGDPDRGFGKRQPGGWIFNLAPFTEENSRRQAASDGKPEVNTPQQLAVIREIVVHPLPLIGCPSRRAGMVFSKPWDGTFVAYNSAPNPESANVAGRSDYAINCGDPSRNEVGGGISPGAGPGNMNVLRDESVHNWCLSESGKVLVPGCSDRATGVSFQRSEVASRQITDGLSKTYLIGEKYMNPNQYETGTDSADNETWCTGYNNDNYRSTLLPPQQDRLNFAARTVFGSAHPAVFMISFCDGRVEGIAYDIDPRLHRSNGNRLDGSFAGELWPQ